MTVTNRDSTIYARLYTNKYVGDRRDLGGDLYPIPFSHTVVSGETGGASAGVRDTVNLCKLPAGCEVVGLDLVAENLWASAGVNGTFQIGDAGDDDRYMVAAEAYTAAGGPIATEGGTRGGRLAFAGMLYRPTADTVVKLEWRVANPTVGKIVKGCFWVILGA